MEEQDIQDMLDSLDMQFAKGKIDQSTYSELARKWQEKLQAFKKDAVAVGGSSYAPPAAASAPPKAETLACPICQGKPDADELPQDLSQPIKCGFCGNMYTLKQSQDDAQRLKQELKSWLEQVLVSSGAGGAQNIDMNARRFIFKQSLYPALKRDIDRQLEMLEDAPEAPLFPLNIMPGFRDYRPNSQLVAIGMGDNQELKRLSNRATAQELQDFATVEVDRQELKALQFRVTTLVYYANIARFLESAEPTSYQLVRQNVQALQKECRAYTQEVADAGYRSYLQALDARITGALLLLDVLVPTLEQGRSFAPEAARAQLDRALAQYTQAAQQAAASTYNPLYVVPLKQGIQKDMLLAQVFYEIIKCYEVVAQTGQVEFGAFYQQLIQYTRALVSVQSPDQMLGLVQSICRLLAARSGSSPTAVLTDWSWLDAAIEANRRKPTFGAAEKTGSPPKRHYHPYWVATLNYAEKQGIIFKTGAGREALILIDATSVDAPIIGYLLANDPALPVISSTLSAYGVLDQQLMALPALLSRDMAEQAMKRYASQHTAELGATVVKMVDLIYLPVAFVSYVGKNQTREILLGRLNFVNQNLRNALGQTYQFLQQYGA